MDFQLPEELSLLKDNVRKFVDAELIPIERDVCDGHKIKPEMRTMLEEKAQALGLWLFDVPVEHGGQGLGLLAKAVVWTELARTIALPTRAASIFGPLVSPILFHLNDQQKEHYLYPVIRGEKVSCFVQTEPDAGGDPGAMRTTAVRHGDEYVINGTKRFITNADASDFAQVFAATDREKGSRGGISAFLVDMDTPGIKLLRQQETMMDDRPWEIAFDDVRVPAENLIGEEGEGFKHAQNWISEGRVRHGARGIGVIERCLELGASYAKQRVTFGQPLADRQAVQWMLVDMYTELHQLRLMVHQAAWKADQGGDIRYESYMCKYFGDTKSFEAADRCMQIHGGLGLTTDLPIEKMWRDQRSFIITEGPTEILKMALARQVLREYG
ncbi:MAG: acyl-CoA dehydrogenase [Rhodospirillaceae bacterium]|jgi:acyl-CoA dehydrogenase|nr:acyl-CoA dehydrogenase [Rhodospirillaceae bacterium]MBT3886481.1 acyl-CoA dehydrogenase [Rhodospirillaceae bacterium]MBT4117944.1 acyl-CoA dehydrogenase [Rhodospirillaceae bacterium]MBT4671582.1 acyl-CoA dehydrogenase [Rhodospirillaceae bacterium]MBT4750950.1 acyl-CoA dehydrogenase [Rhodospirillaceae bacterium]